MARPKKAKASMTALRGIVQNNISPVLIAATGAQFGRIDWDASLWDPTYTPPTGYQWLIDLHHSGVPMTDFTVEHVRAIAQSPAYMRLFPVFNEPDWTGGTDYTDPEEAARQYCEYYYPIVTAGDPDAKFILPCGIYLNPPSAPGSWHSEFWGRIPRGELRAAVVGWHTHCYYWQNPRTLSETLKVWKDWRNDKHPTRSLWLTEVGRGIAASAEEKQMYSPQEVQAKCNKHDFAGWCWAFEGVHASGLQHLVNYDGTLTAEGQAFRALAN